MKSRTTDNRSGLKKRRFRSFILLAMSAVLFLLSGCAEESVDDAADCQTQLDNRRFQIVADSAACSNYERGSAELSLAGFLFENFLKEDADSNFPSALSLTSTGCATAGTDSLTGSAYNSSYQQGFLRAQYWSRTKPQNDGITRSNATTEISYFSTLGEIISQTYCEIDANLDGTITEAENQAFTQINIGGSAVGSSDLNSGLNLYQIVASGVPWLCDSSGSDVCRQDLTYEGVWDNLGAAATTSYAGLLGSPGNISAISAIVSVVSLQQLFNPTATTADIGKPYTFLSMYTNRANLLLTDLTALGVSESDDIYESVRESVGAMDNGGTCTSNSAKVLELLTKIAQNSAPQSSAGALPATKYQTYNLLKTSEIPQIDTGEGELATVCPTCVTMKIRLIFKNGGTYTGLYKTADAAIAGTLTNLATLTLDSSNNPIPVVAGDEIIALKELVCMDP